MGPYTDDECTTKPDSAASALSAGLGAIPKFIVEPLGGLHCLFLEGQSGPYIWGFEQQGEATAIKEALNVAMRRAGCMVPNAELRGRPLADGPA